MPLTLPLTFLWAAVRLMPAIFPPFTGLVLASGAEMTAWVTSHIYIRIFRSYLPDKLEEERKRIGSERLHRDRQVL